MAEYARTGPLVEWLGLFVLCMNDPLQPFDCRICGGTHRNGLYARQNHRLLVECGSPVIFGRPVGPGSMQMRGVSIPQALALADEQGTDGGTGGIVGCSHQPVPHGYCAGQALYETGHGLFTRRMDGG